MSAAGGSDAWSATDDGCTPLRCWDISLANLQAELAVNVRGWTGDTATAERVVNTTLDLVLEAEAGCLFVVAPSNLVGQLRRCAVHVDAGYMTQKLKDEKVWSEEFRQIFLQFAAYSETSLWPRDHPDSAARGQPQEGAMIASGSGGLKRAAVTLPGLPRSQHSWPGHGARHTAALQIASFLEHTIVFVKSDGGDLHVLIGQPAKTVVAFSLQTRRQAADAKRTPTIDGGRCVEPPAGPEGWKHVLRRRLREVLQRQPMSVEDVWDLRASITAGKAAGLGEADLEAATRRMELETCRTANLEANWPMNIASNPQDA